MPATKAGGRLLQLMQCIGESESASRNSFVENGFDDQSSSAKLGRSQMAAELHRDLQTVELQHVLASTEYSIKANCRTGVGSVIQISISVSSEPPHRITDIDSTIVNTASRGVYTDKTDFPEGRMHERIRTLLSAINSNDVGNIKRYIRKETSKKFQASDSFENHVRRLQAIYETSGGVDYYGIRDYGTDSLDGENVFIVRNRLTLGWNALVLKCAPGQASLVDEIVFATARPPDNSAAENEFAEADFASETASYLKRLEFADLFSGAILIARDGKVIHRTAMGLACRRFDVPNEIETKFNLGSMNKMFTGIAVMQLVQQGKLSLDDSLGKYLPESWLPQSVSDKIQIKHLLTHSSGLGSYFNSRYESTPKNDLRELEDFRPLVVGDRPEFDPGTKFKYSNTGMLLLGVVIEKASGKDYFEYVNDNIYKPAGMEDSGCFEMDRPIAGLATGYFNENGQWKNNNFLHVIRGGPAGGGVSTVEDLWRFANALQDNKLLDQQHLEMTLSPKPDLHSPNYGFGFDIQGTASDRIVGHSGGFPGINSQLDIYLDAGFTVVVMSNRSDGAAPVAQAIRTLIIRVK